LEETRRKHPNWHLYGLDSIDVACAKTMQKGFKVFCGDITELNMPENFFDVVNMSHILEHLNDPKAALLKANLILKKGGKLIISLPNFDSLAAKFFGRYWHALDVPRHLFFFTPKTLSFLLEQTGFSVQKISYTQGPRVGILSLYYLLGRKDMRINPVIWRIFKPISIVSAKFKKTSVMTINAVK
jgi:SAM-dependent methyltransferase